MKPSWLHFSLLPCMAIVGCGSRSGLQVAKEKAESSVECMSDADCAVAEDMCAIVSCQAGTCEVQGRVSCDDGDPCTSDSCETETGECRNEPVTYDLDGDGHRAPLPGFLPGEPGSCGDDCDDTNPNAFPDNGEVCDGVDNDCNGVVDDGTTYVPANDVNDAILVSAEAAPSSPGGIAFGNGSYLAAHTGRVSGKDGVYVNPIGASLGVGEGIKVNNFPADASGGPVVWTGDRFGIAWSDRRDGDFEIYFNTLDESGKKRGPDVAITNEIGFSLGAAMTWTGREFVVLFQDDRYTSGGSNRFHVYGQRLDLDGKLLGSNVALSSGAGFDNESPQIATGLKGFGVVWTRTDAGQSRIVFQPFDFELKPITKQPIELGAGVYPTITWNKAARTYLVAFYDPNHAPYAIYGATLTEEGDIKVSPRPITDSPRHSRYPALLPLGDRSLLVFSDDKDENQGYELYTKMLDDELMPLGPELRLTHSPGDSVFPLASFGSGGDVGVLFRDDRNSKQSVWFSRLVCVAGE